VWPTAQESNIAMSATGLATDLAMGLTMGLTRGLTRSLPNAGLRTVSVCDNLIRAPSHDHAFPLPPVRFADDPVESDAMV
jgi:hypothetical protein